MLLTIIGIFILNISFKVIYIIKPLYSLKWGQNRDMKRDKHFLVLYVIHIRNKIFSM